MDATEKLLKKIRKGDKKRILKVLKLLREGKIKGIKLKDKKQFKVRVGRYRIQYHLKGDGIIIVSVRLRDEKTYKK